MTNEPRAKTPRQFFVSERARSALFLATRGGMTLAARTLLILLNAYKIFDMTVTPKEARL